MIYRWPALTGSFRFKCDRGNSLRCEREINTGTGIFEEARRTMSSAGWRVFGTPGHYNHCCSRCIVPRN